jgi:hypothetical protein
MAITDWTTTTDVPWMIYLPDTADPETRAQWLAPYEQYRDPITGLYHFPLPEAAEVDEVESAGLAASVEVLRRHWEEERAEVRRLREALVEERAARLWYRWVAEIGYGLSGEWEDGDSPDLLPEHQTRRRFRALAAEELGAIPAIPE